MQKIQPIFVDSIPSTNEAVKALARDGAPEGVLMIARAQTHGYGRLDRAFFSPPDTGLYMSLLLRPSFPTEKAHLLTHAAALAVMRAVREVSERDARIKWVNDVYVDGKKAAGILVESALAKDGTLSYAVLGIGVNLFTPTVGFPPHLSHVTALFPSERGGEYTALRDALVRGILFHFSALYDAFPATDFLGEYKENMLLLGKEVLVYDALTDREKKGVGKAATAIDVTDDGALLVAYGDGRREALSAGEVTLKEA
ncbi:MAG: biotin--[acetyl-CoA-carboxylase] ligase [Ruminococcaceae bacterium]|nr:biotin--[acetyl-CoA-carboxylase] ligase [Oscillospiraceae bacterium]